MSASLAIHRSASPIGGIKRRQSVGDFIEVGDRLWRLEAVLFEDCFIIVKGVNVQTVAKPVDLVFVNRLPSEFGREARGEENVGNHRQRDEN